MKSNLVSFLSITVLLLTACDSGSSKTPAPVPVSYPQGIRIHDASIIEGDVGTTQLNFWVSLESSYVDVVTFDYASADGTALDGVDYHAVSGSASIATGELGTSITVDIIGDTDSHIAGYEGDEDFTVSLSNVSANVTEIGLNYAVGVIENDEGFTKYQAASINSGSGTGAHSLLHLSGGNLISVNNIDAVHSDMNIAAFGQNIYRIQKYTGANVARFDRNQSAYNSTWNYSAIDYGRTAAQTNPQNLIILNTSKAYLTRYGQSTVLIVNPSATRIEQFKIGELDLSVYADADGIPEIQNGVIVGNKLYLTIQRLSRNNGWAPENTAYVAVFDTTTDKEIDTDPLNPGLLGVPLTIRNPTNDIVYLASVNEVYVQGIGDYSSAAYPGGIEAISTINYGRRLVVNDEAGVHGKSSAMALVSDTQGYLVGYHGWGNASLYPFNPSTGAVGAALPGFVGKHVSDISVGPQGRLWLSEGGGAATLSLLDTTSDTLIDSVSTYLDPGQVVFFSP